jgi:RNA polymerase sigma-70 factor (ECF subfamily)
MPIKMVGMSSQELSPSQFPQSRRDFATTRWSLVLAARRRSTAESRQALAALCAAYWSPLYAYIRRRGFQIDEAQDLTQEFFARMLEKQSLEHVSREKGRFRAFLLASLKNFLANYRRDERALKRRPAGGIMSLDFAAAEERYRLEPLDRLTPEKLYERRWALALLEQTLARLQAEYEVSGKAIVFERLKPYLSAGREANSYAEAAADLDMSEGAVKVAVHRLRRRYRELLRREVAQTVADPDDLEEELRSLFEALS